MGREQTSPTLSLNNSLIIYEPMSAGEGNCLRCAFVRSFPVSALHPSTCIRSEPVNDGLWTYKRVDGRYLRIQAARVEWAPRGMAVVFQGKRG